MQGAIQVLRFFNNNNYYYYYYYSCYYYYYCCWYEVVPMYICVVSVSLSGLSPSAEYRVIVYSVNGVSDVSGVTHSSDVIIRTEPPGKSGDIAFIDVKKVFNVFLFSHRFYYKKLAIAFGEKPFWMIMVHRLPQCLCASPNSLFGQLAEYEHCMKTFLPTQSTTV